MSATARRKQEEKHLKLVRELGSRPHNRQCFECEQRGPTYIDITVGSFVCTSCSGILRGLNPPHRVKSISMTTFTEQEIEFLQSHGNEVCRQIWLGLFDSRSSVIPDYRDPQKIKEFLQDKYEKKKWYVPPDRVKVSAATSATTSLSSRSSTPDVKPLKTLMGDSTPALSVTKSAGQVANQAPVQHQNQQPVKKSQLDLLADIGGDPFASPAPQHTAAAQAFGAFPAFGAQQTVHPGFPGFSPFSSGGSAHVGNFPPATQAPFQVQSATSGGSSSANFANFDTFPKSSSTSFGSFTSSQATSVPAGSTVTASGKQAASQADKYAALADLESIFNAPKSSAAAGGQMSGFSFTSATSSQPTVSSSHYTGAEYSSVFNMGVPSNNASAGTSSISGTMTGSQVPTQQAGTTNASSFGAPMYGGVPPGYGPTSVPGGFTGFPQHPFSQQQPQQQHVFAQPQAYPQQQGYSQQQQQQAFAQQHSFLQPQGFTQQQNGAGFGAFGQSKGMPQMMGPLIQGGGVPSNPFMTGAPPGQFAAGSTSTNPFL
ncbi:arf-GAP domain and FG repeat-containing protein 1-like isoform X3 [Hemiscyllium ocellatum]|uniref:arf-GAP domain and FG repeat-containing protein 1-like isoform X3 n=1 Tax=Hemiscyllium ocellatum TaxID=170820 RepID=UPI00296636BA|nr:arf-GAP domain and FG repeat-containing protein 1-like isoform X3 [Hemiscyllium ocellatum]